MCNMSHYVCVCVSMCLCTLSLTHICLCVCCSDGDELKKSLSELVDKSDHTRTKSISRISSGSNPFLNIAHDPNAAVYKTGFLARKIHADMDGKKSKIIIEYQSIRHDSQ